MVRKLDREQLTQYQLVRRGRGEGWLGLSKLGPFFNVFVSPRAQIIKAEDDDGLSSTATVNIKVSDINDKNPEFINLPYEFSVAEGKGGAPVGQVKAMDADEGQNAVVHYSLPSDIPFVVDVNTGDIRTKSALDYEQQSVNEADLCN